MQYEIARRTEFDGSKLQAMHTLRAQVFKYKKGWDVTLIAGMEIDGYDALNPFYMLINSQAQPNDVQGCWRLLPTTGPYMLKDTFPELLAATAPEASDVWGTQSIRCRCRATVNNAVFKFNLRGDQGSHFFWYP